MPDDQSNFSATDTSDSAEGVTSKSHDNIATMLCKQIASGKIPPTKDDKGKNQPTYAVALLGPWGSGKTYITDKIIKDLGNSAGIIHFNAWLHAGEDPKRAFLSQMVRDLTKDDQNKRTQLLEKVENDTYTSDEHTSPKFNPYLLLGRLGLVLLALSAALFSKSEELGDLLPLLKGSLDTILVIMLFAPIWTLILRLIVWAIHHTIIKDIDKEAKPPKWNEALLAITATNTTQTTNSKTTSAKSSLYSFAEKFKDIRKKASRDDCPLVIIVDDLDRIPGPDARKVWETLTTFFDAAIRDQALSDNATKEKKAPIWLIVPIATEGLEPIFGEAIKSNQLNIDVDEKKANGPFRNSLQNGVRADVTFTAPNWRKVHRNIMIDGTLQKTFDQIINVPVFLVASIDNLLRNTINDFVQSPAYQVQNFTTNLIDSDYQNFIINFFEHFSRNNGKDFPQLRQPRTAKAYIRKIFETAHHRELIKQSEINLEQIAIYSLFRTIYPSIHLSYSHELLAETESIRESVVFVSDDQIKMDDLSFMALDHNISFGASIEIFIPKWFENKIDLLNINYPENAEISLVYKDDLVSSLSILTEIIIAENRDTAIIITFKDKLKTYERNITKSLSQSIRVLATLCSMQLELKRLTKSYSGPINSDYFQEKIVYFFEKLIEAQDIGKALWPEKASLQMLIHWSVRAQGKISTQKEVETNIYKHTEYLKSLLIASLTNKGDDRNVARNIAPAFHAMLLSGNGISLAKIIDIFAQEIDNNGRNSTYKLGEILSEFERSDHEPEKTLPLDSYFDLQALPRDTEKFLLSVDSVIRLNSDNSNKFLLNYTQYLINKLDKNAISTVLKQAVSQENKDRKSYVVKIIRVHRSDIYNYDMPPHCCDIHEF